MLHETPFTLETTAPEMFNELLVDIKEGFTIHLKDDDLCRAYVSSDCRTITISRGLVECLWCASYAYNAFLLELTSQSKRHKDGPQRLEINSKDNPEIELAIRTLKAAVIAASEGSALSWDGLPHPVKPQEVTGDSSLIVLAGEMTLCSLGYILHHELAHIRLGHRGNGDAQWTLDQEKEADGEAIQWILGKAPADPETILEKRLWGIGIATIFLTAIKLIKLPDKTKARETHPQPYERLDKVMQHEAIQRNEAVREKMVAIACSALVPHIRISGLDLNDGPFDDWNHLYNECLNVLSTALVR